MEQKTAVNRIEMVGQTFNKWRVDSFSHREGKTLFYNCTCTNEGCGVQHKVRGCNLRSGLSKQCTKCALKDSHKKNTGVPLTEERKRKISESKKGIKLSPERVAQMRGPKDHLCDPELLAIDPTRTEDSRGLRIKTVIRGKRNSAKHDWYLTDLEAAKIITQPCDYCGSLPDPYNGIDRVDNTRGYELDNVVPCCMDCNFSKYTRTREEFLNWIKRVYNHNKLGE
jgi:hypothetical protein